MEIKLEMGYIIDYDIEKDIVNVKVKGKLNFKLAKKYSVEAPTVHHWKSLDLST